MSVVEGATQAPPRRWGSVAAAVGRGLAVLVLVALVWEAVKLVAPEAGVRIGDVSLLPRTDDVAMPHVWDVVARMGRAESSATGAVTVGQATLAAAWYTLRIALAGWFLGVVGGFGLAVLMQRWRTAESAVLPWVIVSQTVPLVALAPLVVGWGGKIHLGSFAWERWMSVALIASYLAFFPVAVGALRGLQSPIAAQVDLFRAQGASWWRTLVHLRLPASVPFVLPALRLGAATAVVGAIVAEVSTGTRGGIGRLIISYAQAASGDPGKPWAAIIGAAALGLLAAGLVGLVGTGLTRFRHGEAA